MHLRLDAVAAAEFAAALACVLLFLALGRVVTPRPLTWIDLRMSAARNLFTRVAIAFTWLGYWNVLTPLAILYVAASLLLHGNVWIAAAIVLVQSLSQMAIALLKPHFSRARPAVWLFRQETSFSYPSGHAATAITFYLALIVALSHEQLAAGVRLLTDTVLAACVVGIPWSRLALGAHYITDVAGGILFGATWLFCALAVLHIAGYQPAGY